MGKKDNYNPWKIVGFIAVFIITGFASYGQNSQMPGNTSSDQTNTSQVAPSNQNTSAAQSSSFETYAVQFANQLAQQTGLSKDKADDIRKILVDYYNNIRDAKQAFLRDRRDPRSQDADNSRRNNNSDNNNQDVTGGQTGNNAGSGNNSNNNTGDNTGSGNNADNSGSSAGYGNNTGSGGSSDNTGSSNTDVTGKSTNSTGTSGAAQARSNQDLMSEYQKADIQADKKILDVFDNDSQKAKYVQVKRQWWQDVKDKAFSSPYDNSNLPPTR